MSDWPAQCPKTMLINIKSEHGDVSLEDRIVEKVKCGVWVCAPMDDEIGDGHLLDHPGRL